MYIFHVRRFTRTRRPTMSRGNKRLTLNGLRREETTNAKNNTNGIITIRYNNINNNADNVKYKGMRNNTGSESN